MSVQWCLTGHFHYALTLQVLNCSCLSPSVLLPHSILPESERFQRFLFRPFKCPRAQFSPSQNHIAHTHRHQLNAPRLHTPACLASCLVVSPSNDPLLASIPLVSRTATAPKPATPPFRFTPTTRPRRCPETGWRCSPSLIARSFSPRRGPYQRHPQRTERDTGNHQGRLAYQEWRRSLLWAEMRRSMAFCKVLQSLLSIAPSSDR